MNDKDKRIRDILIEQNYVTEDDIAQAEKYAKEKHTSLVEYLLRNELLTKDILGQAMAESFGLPFANIDAHPPHPDVVMMLPETLARKYHMVVFKEDDKTVTVATDSPEPTELAHSPKTKPSDDEPKEAGQFLDEVRKHFAPKELKIVYALEEDIEKIMILYRKSLNDRFDAIVKKEDRIAPAIVDEILEDAVIYQASDVHFEPQEKDVLLRFRIDGVLKKVARIDKTHYDNVLNRIKVLSQLRTDEHFATQDGAFAHQIGETKIDMRVSIVPTINGEKVVMRILAAYIDSFKFSDLGLSPENEEMLVAASKKPFGMILVVGPTGSGKTTTLYSLLRFLNKPTINIATIEDPVEYKLTGVNHIQVNPQTNLTFAKGLRSIVRQDPDVILVGEIRDRETADMAVNAALTGHLLLSTFHANDAATGVPRLMDMGVEPFLLSSTLELLIAQRLVRTLCRNCRHSFKVPVEELQKECPHIEHYLQQSDGITLYKSKGCQSCGHTGFRGRTALFEFIPVNDEMKKLILNNPSAGEIWDLAKKSGASTLFHDGIEKVRNGVTTMEELLRVAKPPEFVFENDIELDQAEEGAPAENPEPAEGGESSDSDDADENLDLLSGPQLAPEPAT